MLNRKTLDKVIQKLQSISCVGLIGPRQVGKTTLAIEISEILPSIYLDLENPLDEAKLEDAVSFFQSNAAKLIILDEIQRKPEIFPILRGIIDKNRRDGRKNGQFLVLGSASVDLLRQSSESLAGRIHYIEMPAILASEYEDINTLWFRGGFPDSLLTADDAKSLDWRQGFISTYLERDVPFFAPRVPSTSVRRLWTMLAHYHGTFLNASTLASSLSVSNNTVTRYIDLMDDLFLVYRLQPWFSNIKKRLIKAPKVYVRDSGVLHALLNIPTRDSLLSHPVIGTSWEGFVIENIKGSLPKGSELFHYRASGGSEIDLIIQHANGKTIAVEIKRSSIPKVARGFYEAGKEVQPDEKYVIYQGIDSFYLPNDVLAIGLKDFIQEIEK
ncbi:MAG: ATP-binding protein [Bacteroidota bacterium]